MCCTDINECAMSPCTDPKRECINLSGSFSCVCRTGFFLDPNGECQGESNTLIPPSSPLLVFKEGGDGDHNPSMWLPNYLVGSSTNWKIKVLLKFVENTGKTGEHKI